MQSEIFDRMQGKMARAKRSKPVGFVHEINAKGLGVSGLANIAHVGDRVRILSTRQGGEVVRTQGDSVHITVSGGVNGLGWGMPVVLEGGHVFAPHESWIGRVVDPDGNPLDGRPLLPGATARPLASLPPDAGRRRGLGPRLATGLSVFDTLLPLVRGQRVGLFAGSGVGKSTLLASLARKLEADVIVIGLVGERGRELREFVEGALGPEGMARTVVVAATSDQSAQMRRRCPMAATAVAEYFRDQGKHVLLLVDSVTRFAEAHREVAVATGEAANLRGHPPSTPSAIAGLCERAGPGLDGSGDITAIYTVLVAASDMEEPVADMLRGVLDGHVVLDRAIAERGRFPAIDVTRSVSRSLPRAASEAEMQTIQNARRLIGAYAQAELMIQAGLYVEGSDPLIDEAIARRDALEAFISSPSEQGNVAAFRKLQQALGGAR